MTAFELAGKLKLDSSEFQSSLNQQESSFQKFGNKLSGAAKKVGKVAMAGLATVGAGSVMLIKSSIQEGLDFDAAMSQVAATLGKSTEDIAELSKFARKMGSETAFSATEAAEALNYMALAGYDSEKSMKMLPTVLNLAAAGNMDLARASDMVTDTQSALGLTIEETTELVDKMAKTSSKTNTSVEQLGDAMLTIGGTAKMMKGGVIDTTTELSAVLGVLADNGIKGSEGGTALRNVLLSLSAPTKEAQKAISELGVNIYDAEGNMRDLPDIMADFNKATEGMSSKQRTEYLSKIFNKRDLKAVEALLGTTRERWQELFGEIGNADGAAGEMAGTQLDNLAGDLKILKSAVSEAKLSISEKLTPTLRTLAQKGTQWVNRLTKAFNEKGLKGAISEAKAMVKETLGEYLGVGTDATWSEIGKAAATKIKQGLEKKFGEAKVKLANLLGMTDEAGNAVDDPSDVSWTNIASAAVTKIKEKLKEEAGKAKVKLANMLGMTDEAGNAIDDPSDTTWSNVAKAAYEKIKTGFTNAIGKTKVKLANLLGLTDEAGNVVDDPADISWTSIAKKAYEKIKTGFSNALGSTKVSLANLLGMTDDSGKPIDDPKDVTWTEVAKNVIGKIKTGFKNALNTTKVKLANLLGLTDDSGNAISDPKDTTWKTIASTALTKIKTGFKDAIGNAKVKIANLLGLTDDAGNAVDDPTDTSWSNIADNIKTKLQTAFKNLKVSLASLLGLSADNVEGEATWEDIGREIIGKLTTYFSHKGDFLKKLILGDEFTEESTWLDVGKKISGWLEEAFSDGGLLNVLLTSGLDKLTGLAEVAGKLVQGLAEWIAKPENINTIVGIIENLVNALAKAAGPIVKALITIISNLLTDPEFWSSIKEAVISIAQAIWDALFGDGQPKLDPEADAAKFAAQEAERNTPEAVEAREEAQEKGASQYELNDEQKAALRKFYAARVSGADDTNAIWDLLGAFPEGQLENGFYPLMYWKNKAADWSKKEGAAPELPEDFFNVEVSGDFTSETPGNMQGELDGYGLTAPVQGILTGIDGNGYTDGGNSAYNAKGLWDVPYDDYLTRLHRDEMVLSASRARDYRAGNVGNFNPAELISSVKEAIRSGMENVSVRSYLNGKDITDEVNRNTVKQLKARRFAT